MLAKIAHSIIKNRLFLLIVLGIFTVFMAYKGKDIQMTYSFAKVIPQDDEDMIFYQKFKNTFGDDGGLLVVGFDDSTVYTDVKKFNNLNILSKDLDKIHGVSGVLSIPRVYKLIRDNEIKKLVPKRLIEEFPVTDNSSLRNFNKQVENLKLYDGQIINRKTGASLIAITIQDTVLNSSNRDDLVQEIVEKCENYSKSNNVEIHFAGLPHLRSVMVKKVSSELKDFLILSLLVTAAVLLFFFRNGYAVIIPLVIIAVIVTWSLGTIVLLDYKITLLTGLIPSIIVVIGIPNSVYLLNKYHREYRKSGNKVKALSLVIRRIGIVTLITNITTSIGFFVFCFTNITILKEFGLVAGLNVLGVFIASIILMPTIFTYLPEPNKNQLKHLDYRFFSKILYYLDNIAHHNRSIVYTFSIILAALSIFGITRINTVSYMVDDVPDNSTILKDLNFFENNFKGVMPLEFLVDTKKKKGVMNVKNLKKIEEFESKLYELDEIGRPLSLADFTKSFTQGFYKGNPEFYRLPNNQERSFIIRYLDVSEDKLNLSKNFTDSTGQIARITARVKDIGSVELENLINNKINPLIDSVFESTDMDVAITGTTKIFLKGNSFLIDNFKSSLIIAFIMIAITMAILFGSLKMIIISLSPNILPLLITGGIMGFFGIPLKPSTAIIFSIAFGIAVDDTIHFLAKYKQELIYQKFDVSKAVSMSIKETGASMIYTSIILFFGFVIFTWSDFGGTIALGLLTSITLFIAMLTNLTLLPSLILTLDRNNQKTKNKYSLLDNYEEEFYFEDDDEEIDLDLIAIKGEGEIFNELYNQEIEELKKKKTE